MLEYFNMKPEESVYIGDNPNKDFFYPARNQELIPFRIIALLEIHYENIFR